MPLVEQKIPLVFRGLDTKTDPRHQVVGDLVALRNVFPLSTVDNVADLNLGNAEYVADLQMGHGGRQSPDVLNLRHRQLLAQQVFPGRIIGIVSDRAQKEVIRVDTRRIVTVVARQEVAGNGPPGKFPRHAVGKKASPQCPDPRTDAPVSLSASIPSPYPAWRGHAGDYWPLLIYLFQETLKQRGRSLPCALTIAVKTIWTIWARVVLECASTGRACLGCHWHAWEYSGFGLSVNGGAAWR